MPKLKNPKWEHLAKQMALGQGTKAAALSAGFAPSVASSKASTIARLPAVQDRIAELRAVLRPTPGAEAALGRDLDFLRPDRLRATLIAELRETMVEAREAKDRRTVIAAAQEIATLAGIRITRQESEVTVRHPLDDLSTEAREHLIRHLEDARKPVIDSVAEVVGESAEHLPVGAWAELDPAAPADGGQPEPDGDGAGEANLLSACGRRLVGPA